MPETSLLTRSVFLQSALLPTTEGRGLDNDGGVVAEGGSGNIGGEPNPTRARGRGAEHGPGKREVPLYVEPRVEVVAELHEVEARLPDRRHLVR